MKPSEIEIRLPAIAGLEVVAAEAGAALAAWGGADDTVSGDVRLALIEGCLNAIEHGYDADCDTGEVLVRFRLSPADVEAPAKLTIWIQDSGAGFEMARYHEPVLEEKLHSPDKRGWGLKLMRGFMDDFQIHTSRDGTTIEMTKYLSSREEEAEGVACPSP